MRLDVEAVTLIFPDQLLEDHPAIKSKRAVFLVEEFLFFRVQRFHRQRLMLLRASMKAYEAELMKRGFDVTYIPSDQLKERKAFARELEKRGVKEIHVASFSDEWLKEDLKSFSGKCIFYQTPSFILSEKEVHSFLKKEHASMASFYAGERKRLNLLMEGDKPAYGKFSFDSENRKKLPKGVPLKGIYIPEESSFHKEARLYVQSSFKDALGEDQRLFYPIDFAEAEKALQLFFEERFSDFGKYEDAIKQDASFLFHSVLSPLLNIGLLTPLDVVKQAETAQVPIQSKEGFIRQIIGWREFMRGMYELRGKEDRTLNFFQHKRGLPAGFWEGKTGLPPIDQTIRKIQKYGYCHHIERLMILGNFLLLTETDPTEVYSWFMAFFVDSYDWVMVPNVFGMSQYANGGAFTTKPYISGSNYILKMSDYKEGEWSTLWDGLFWRFLLKHKTLFEKNPRISLLFTSYSKRKEEIDTKIKLAEKRFEI